MAKKFTRSPNYPYLSLEESISKARQIYDDLHNVPADKSNIVKLMGYSGINGSSSSAISALQKFGLLESIGDEYQITNDALDVFLHETGEPERIKFIRLNAFEPSVFADLYDRYGLTPPNDNVMRAYLIKNGFNPRTVDHVIRVYRDTIEFVKEEGAFSVEGVDGEEEAPLGEMSNNAVERAQGGYVASTQTPMQHRGSSNTQERQIEPSKFYFANQEWGDKELKFQVTETCEVRVQLKGEITQEAIERLSAFIELSKLSFPTEAQFRAQNAKEAIWHGKEYDQEVCVTKELSSRSEEVFYAIEGSGTGIPESQLEFLAK